MKLILSEQRKLLLENGARAASGEDTSGVKPVLKLFAPWGSGTWLLSELDPDDPDIAFGLADLGFGTPELGRVSLAELESVRGPFGLGIERDMHFEADKTLSAYAEEPPRASKTIAPEAVVEMRRATGFQDMLDRHGIPLDVPQQGKASRVLYFENGEVVRYDEAQSDGGAVLRVTRDGDVQIVTIGEARFEIVDALLVGG